MWQPNPCRLQCEPTPHPVLPSGPRFTQRHMHVLPLGQLAIPVSPEDHVTDDEYHAEDKEEDDGQAHEPERQEHGPHWWLPLQAIQADASRTRTIVTIVYG